MEQNMDKVIEYVVSNGVNIVVAVIIFIVGKWLAKVIAGLIEKLMIKSKIEQTLATFVRNLSFYGILTFVIIAALNKMGVETTSMVAVVGAAGLAVGLALQGSLANFASGVLLILFKPFKAGDFISAGGTMGSVEEIQIFNTILNAPDNRREIVPNSQITGGIITNFSGIDKRRVDMVIGVSYEADIKKAKKVLLDLLEADSRVLKDPAPVVAVSELADSSVNLVVRPFVKPGDYWAVHFDTLENGKAALEKNGISIPYPQRDVHMYQEK